MYALNRIMTHPKPSTASRGRRRRSAIAPATSEGSAREKTAPVSSKMTSRVYAHIHQSLFSIFRNVSTRCWLGSTVPSSGLSFPPISLLLDFQFLTCVSDAVRDRGIEGLKADQWRADFHSLAALKDDLCGTRNP